MRILTHGLNLRLLRAAPAPIKTFLSWVVLASGLIVVALSARAEDETPERCQICQNRFNGTAYVGNDTIRNQKRFYCEACSKAERCWACGLPTHPKTMVRLDDTRVLCSWDSEGIVLTQEQAEDLFRSHVKDWQRVLSPWPPFPEGNLFVHLVNQKDFLREYRRRPHLENPEWIRGLTMNPVNEKGEREYHIYVLSGLLQNQFLAVLAHEYGHTWLEEHEKPTRQLHADTQEAFCEWLAMKYMVEIGDQIEQKRILANLYTRGQIQALLAAEKQYHMHEVMEWILNGVDSWVDPDKLESILALREQRPAPPAPVAPLAFGDRVVTPVPDTLTLKGISGSGADRFALINNATLAEGEKGSVRVGKAVVIVRCLEIRPDSVLIELIDRKEKQELRLAKKKN